MALNAIIASKILIFALVVVTHFELLAVVAVMVSKISVCDLVVLKIATGSGTASARRSEKRSGRRRRIGRGNAQRSAARRGAESATANASAMWWARRARKSAKETAPGMPGESPLCSGHL